MLKTESHLNVMNRISLAPFLLALMLTFLFGAACNDGGGSGGATATPVQTTVTPVKINTFENADTQPKTREGTETFPSTLAASDPMDFGAFSRFYYYFIEVVPGYDVRYVDQPVDCETGQPIDVGGEAFIQVTLTPARDHNDEGNKTHFPSPDDPQSMPAVADIVQTCDHNDQLTFVFGVVQPGLPFRVAELTRFGLRETIFLDIENP